MFPSDEIEDQIHELEDDLEQALDDLFVANEETDKAIADLKYARESWSLLDRKHQEVTGDLEALRPVARAYLLWLEALRGPIWRKSHEDEILALENDLERLADAMDPALRARLLEGA